MFKKKISKRIVLFSLIIILLLLNIYPVHVGTTAKKTGVTFIISSDLTKLIANTPIIIDPQILGINAEKLPTAIVNDGDVELPTQSDDLDGDGTIDEIVFQLTEEIEVNSSKKFSIYFKENGKNNSQDINDDITLTQGFYNATYSDYLPPFHSSSFMNGTTLSEDVHEVGKVVWIKTDWGILCLYVEAGWRQSSWKHIILKNEDWDVVMGSVYDAVNDWRWRWSKMWYEADRGWHTGLVPDKVSIAKVGPVRVVIQTVSGIGYNGIYGIAKGLNTTRTYKIYNGFAGITQNFRLTGDDAIKASVNITEFYGNPLDFASKWVDLGLNTTVRPWVPNENSNGFNRIYGPNMPNMGGNDSRYNLPELMNFNLSKVTAPYFGMYNDEKEGFMVYWGDVPSCSNSTIHNCITKVDWSDGEIDVKYSFEQFPLTGLDRVMVPFKATGDVTSHVDSLYEQWTFDYTITDVTPITQDDGFSSFVLSPTLIIVLIIPIILRKRRDKA
ncbi:MAG: DUF4861 family protein [Candidatus Hodarchaeales archaeon]